MLIPGIKSSYLFHKTTRSFWMYVQRLAIVIIPICRCCSVTYFFERKLARFCWKYSVFGEMDGEKIVFILYARDWKLIFIIAPCETYYKRTPFHWLLNSLFSRMDEFCCWYSLIAPPCAYADAWFSIIIAFCNVCKNIY